VCIVLILSPKNSLSDMSSMDANINSVSYV
jgi:hypothetical protein